MIFQHLTAEDGLSDNRIQSFYRDHNNYIWIGTTEQGLNRFDGYQSTIFRYDENIPGSISNNDIQCIFEDSHKNLWIGTANGLNLFNPLTETFTVFNQNPDDTNSLAGSFISGIIEDINGSLWIANDYVGGLSKWVPEKKNFIRYQIPVNNNDPLFNSITSIKEDLKGNIWIVTRGRGIICYKPETVDFIAYDDSAIDFGNYTNKSLYIDRQNNIWITSFGSGFYSFDPKEGKFEHFRSNMGNRGLNLELVGDVIQEDDNHLLLAIDQGGINRFNKVTKTFEYILSGGDNQYRLNSNGILSLYKDWEGILWVGTSRGGVNYYNPKSERFKLFTHNADNPNSLSYNIVGCFYEDSQGRIWIGTDGGGADIYNPNTETFKNFKHDPQDPYSISGNVIRCIVEDKDHNIWIGTWGAGLNRYNSKTGKFHHYFPESNDTSSISNNSIWHMKIDYKNQIWLSGYYNGIDILDTKKGVIKRFRADPNNPKALSNDGVWLFYEDEQHNMWICTINGINLYDSITNTFIKYNNFPENDIRAFCKDKEGKLWAGSVNSGVFSFFPDGTIDTIYDKTNGLPNNTIHAIVVDNNENLWISTNNGLSHFNQKTMKFRNYFKEDGLQSDHFFISSYLKARNGEIYFGGSNGFNSFYPDNIKDNDFIPPVYITDFKIFNKDVSYGIPGAILQNHISETKKITLSWRNSVFSFEYVAINYTHPHKNKYAYIMEGFENEWNYVGNRREATYTNLNPGEYVFKVKASNNDGVWNKKGTSLKITITPPFWQTWFFRISLSLLIITMIISIYYIRINQIKKQKKILEILVNEKTKELTEANALLNETNTILEERQQRIEEQAEELKSNTEELNKKNIKLNDLVATKDKFFSIIGHDLKNPFGIILGMSELLENRYYRYDDEKRLNQINQIHLSAKNIYTLLENLLQWARSQMGKISYQPSETDLKQTIQNIFNLVSNISNKKGVELINNIAENTFIYVDINMINTVFRNLITNAIKFTEKGSVTIESEIKDKVVIISIRDTGTGMSKEELGRLFKLVSGRSKKGTKGETGTGLGLILCKDFIEKNKGKIWVESKVGKGTTFYISLPKINFLSNV